MATIVEWVKLRTSERLAGLLDDFASRSNIPQPRPVNVAQNNIHGFLLVRVAELQARVDCLEARMESIQETVH